MSKTPILKVLARVSFYWQPMTICGKNVDTLRPCKRSNRDFFWLWSTENTHIPSSPVFLYITRGVLRCLLGFLALWGQKPCGGNYLIEKLLQTYDPSVSFAYWKKEGMLEESLGWIHSIWYVGRGDNIAPLRIIPFVKYAITLNFKKALTLTGD